MIQIAEVLGEWCVIQNIYIQGHTGPKLSILPTQVSPQPWRVWKRYFAQTWMSIDANNSKKNHLNMLQIAEVAGVCANYVCYVLQKTAKCRSKFLKIVFTVFAQPWRVPKRYFAHSWHPLCSSLCKNKHCNLVHRCTYFFFWPRVLKPAQCTECSWYAWNCQNLWTPPPHNI